MAQKLSLFLILIVTPSAFTTFALLTTSKSPIPAQAGEDGLTPAIRTYKEVLDYNLARGIDPSKR